MCVRGLFVNSLMYNIMAKLASIGDYAILAAVTMLMTLYHPRIGTDKIVLLYGICALCIVAFFILNSLI